MVPFSETSSVSVLNGIGPKRAAALAKIGIHTLHDLVFFFPRTYENRARIVSLSRGVGLEQPASFLLTVATVPQLVRIRKNMNLLKFRAFDDTGSIDVVFFNSPFLKNAFVPGVQFRFFGRLTQSKSRKFQLISPKFDVYTENGNLPSLVPIYRTPEGFSQKSIASIIDEALSYMPTSMIDPLPKEIKDKMNFPSKRDALLMMHRPSNEEELNVALQRIVFEELYFFALGLAFYGRQEHCKTIQSFTPINLTPFLQKLPFHLTKAQMRVLAECEHDMCREEKCPISPMTRILVGDVGSGKTVVAALAMYIAVKNKTQCAMMVPTEILAHQHYHDIEPIFSSLGLKTLVLIGSMTKKEKDSVYHALSHGEVDIVIGTHALLNENVQFANLGLVITDEQHRFGVMQRATLKKKSETAHLLVMSATPIPRTLALTMYGDLDLSIIDEMPPNRGRVDTFVINSTLKERLFAFIDKQVQENGGQVYIVCPCIEDEEESPLLSAVNYAHELQTKIFPHLRIDFLHGKMKAAERDSIMQKFASGELDILVSTTVIEVGVNVPNATLMIIENAERFGLSQLHQLRGRVGRGSKKSYCILVSDTEAETAKRRLETIRTTYDGYRIAESDLAARGPGDFFASLSDGSLRQSGGLTLKSAHLCHETKLMQEAFESARETIRVDATLSLPEHNRLLDEINHLFTFQHDTLS